jgi:hypothetical protein
MSHHPEALIFELDLQKGKLKSKFGGNFPIKNKRICQFFKLIMLSRSILSLYHARMSFSGTLTKLTILKSTGWYQIWNKSAICGHKWNFFTVILAETQTL